MISTFHRTFFASEHFFFCVREGGGVEEREREGEKDNNPNIATYNNYTVNDNFMSILYASFGRLTWMLAENDTFMLTSELGVNMNTQCNLTGDPSAVHDINVLLASPLM